MAEKKLAIVLALGAIGIAGTFFFGRALTRPEPPLFSDAGEGEGGLPPVTLIDESPLPARWEDAEPHVVAVVRPRLGQETARLLASKGAVDDLPPLPPHVDLGGGYWGELAYETKKQFIRIPAGQWPRWKIEFERAWAGAAKRLAARSETPLKRGGRALRESQFGDDNDTARVLVPSIFETIDLKTAVIAMPRRSLLLVADPQNETALEELSERLLTEDEEPPDQHVLVWTAGKLAPFVPPPGRLHAVFVALERAAHQADVGAQTQALKERLGESDDVPFVASLFRVKNPTTQDEFTYVVHTEGVTTLLPRAEYVCFTRVDLEKHTSSPQACAAWDTVHARMKDRWTETTLYPARWLVAEFPRDDELKAFGFAKKIGPR